MPLVKVYDFRRIDMEASTPMVRRMGTLSAIASLYRCEPVADTEREIDATLLDPYGFVVVEARLPTNDNQ